MGKVSERKILQNAWVEGRGRFSRGGLTGGRETQNLGPCRERGGYKRKGAEVSGFARCELRGISAILGSPKVGQSGIKKKGGWVFKSMG